MVVVTTWAYSLDSYVVLFEEQSNNPSPLVCTSERSHTALAQQQYSHSSTAVSTILSAGYFLDESPRSHDGMYRTVPSFFLSPLEPGRLPRSLSLPRGSQQGLCLQVLPRAPSNHPQQDFHFPVPHQKTAQVTKLNVML